MVPPKSKLTEKAQTTIPMEIRNMFGIKPKDSILWLPVAPGVISLVVEKKYQKGSWTKNVCGKYSNGSDTVDELLQDRKEDLLLEERGFLNDKT